MSKTTNSHHRPSPLRAGGPRILATSIVAMLVACGLGQNVHGQTWTGSNGSDWNNAGNWSPATVPNNGSAAAIFDISSVQSVALSATTQVGAITFTANATSPYTITVAPSLTFTLSGTGITNSSGVTQNLVTANDGNGHFGTLIFTGSASAGTGTEITNNGTTSFTGQSDGGTAQLINNSASAIFDISGLTDGGMNIGSIAGDGHFYLGGNTLTVGGDNMSTTVSGVIADGGAQGGTGGSLVVAGTGTLTLAAANTYTGTTSIINGATLVANVAGALSAPSNDGGAGTVRTAVSMDQSGTSGSTLVLGASQAISSLTGAVLSTVNLQGNTLTIGSTNAATVTEFDGLISDGGSGGSLIKTGASTQILGGAGTYTGTTTVKGGTLQVNGTLTAGSAVNVLSGATLSGRGSVEGTVTVLSGGTLQPGGATPDTLTIGNLVLNPGANSNFRLQEPGIAGAGTNDLVSVTGNLTLGGALNVTQIPGFGIGVYPLFTYAGTLTNNGISAVNGLTGYTTYLSTVTANEVDLVVTLGLAQYWDGNGKANDGVITGGAGTWSGTTKNWTTADGTVNSTWQGGTALFTGTGATVTLSGTLNAQGLIFGTTGYTLGGGTLNLNGTTPAISVTNDSDTATISAKITGSNGLAATGAGTLVLTNSANTYTGGTAISTGTLQVGTTAAGSLGPGQVSVNNGGILLLMSVTGNVLANSMTNGITGLGTINVGSSGTITLSGILSDGAVGQLGLTQGGLGTTILTNSGNTYTGQTTISVGTLQIGTATVAGSIGAGTAVNIGDGGILKIVNVVGNTLGNNIQNNLGVTGTVVISSTSPTTLTGTLSDGNETLALTQSGTGTTILTGADNYSGATTVSAGTLQIGNGTLGSLTGGTVVTVSGTGTLALDLAAGGSFAQNVTLSGASASLKAVQATGTTTISGVISGTGTLVQNGSGTTTLTGLNTYTGATNITLGTLDVEGTLAAGSTVNVGTTGTLAGNGRINGKATLTGNGIIDLGSSGEIASTLAVTGGSWNGVGKVDGLVTASGATNTFTIASGDTLTAVAGLALTSGKLGGAGTLLGNLTDTSTATFTFGGVIGGAGTLTLNSATATLTLSNDNTYSGATTISAGTLQIGAGTTGSLVNTSGVKIAGTGSLVLDLADGASFGTPVNLSAAGTSLKAIQTGKTTINSVLSGTGVFVQSGTGTTVLNGTQTYTGATNITAGTLDLEGTLAALSIVNVGTAGTLTGSGKINGKATLTGNGIIDLGSNGEIVGTLTVTGGNWNGLGKVDSLITASGATNTFTIATGDTLTAVTGLALTSGKLGGNGTLLGNFTDTSTASFTFGGVIGGTGALTLNSATATLTLSNDNTYSGATTISAGTLQIGTGTTGSIVNTSGVKIAGTGVLALDLADGASFGTPVNLSAAGTSLKTIQTGKTTINSLLSGTGVFVQSGIGTTVLNGTQTYTGATNITAGTLDLEGTLAALSTVNVGAAGTLIGSGKINGKATLTGNGIIDLGSNGEIAGTLAVTGGNWNGLGKVDSLITASGATNTFTIATGDTLTAVTGLALTSGKLGGNGTLLGNFTDTSTASFTFGGIIGGTGALTLNSATATLTLSNDNTYSGATTISAGTLQIGTGATGSLVNTSGVKIAGAGVLALDLADGASFGTPVNLSAAGTSLKTTQTGKTTINSLLSGTGVFVQSGIGTTVLNGTQTYTGATNITAGTLDLEGTLAALSTVNVGAAGTLIGSGKINGKATLTGNGIIDFGSNGEIVGTLAVTGGNWNGLGKVDSLITASGATNTFTIGTGDTLTAAGGLALTSGKLGGNGTLLGTFTDTSATSFTFGGIISGAGALTMNNASATLTLSNDNTYTGATIVSAGTLQVGTGATGTLPSTSAVTTSGSGTLLLNLANNTSFTNNVTDNAHVTATGTTNNYTITSPISGTGNLTKTGANTVTLTGINTYKGGTIVNAGTLLVNNPSGSGTGTGAVTINTGATLGGSGTITGSTTLNKGGIIAPGVGSPGTAGTILHASSLLWNGGSTLTFQLGATSDELILSGALTKGAAGTFTINLVDAGITQSTYTLLTFASTTFAATNFTLQLPSNYTGTLVETSTSLMIENLTDPPVHGESLASTTTMSIDSSRFATSMPTSDLANPNLIATPEPTSALLLSLSGGALLGWRRRPSRA